jgi:NADH dehydrogenase
LSMPGNRVRTATEWLFDATLHRQTTQLGVIPAADVPLETASPERVRPH